MGLQVCVTKAVNAPDSFSGSTDATITITADTDGDGTPEVQSQVPGTTDCNAFNTTAEFFLPLGADFVLGEDLSGADPTLAPTSMRCSFGANLIVADATQLEVAALEVELDSPLRSSVNCFITNSTLQVCVSKQTFVADSFSGSTDVTITVSADTDGDGVAEVQSQPLGTTECNLGDDNTAEFFLAPGTDFTLGELIPPGLGPTSMECNVANGDATDDQLSAVALPVVVDRDRDKVSCDISNRTMQVCVVKRVFPLSVASTVSIPITISADLDGDGVREEVARAEPGDTDCFGTPKTAQFFLPPGTPFTLGEDLTGDPRFRPTLIECQNIEATDAELAVASLPVIPEDGLQEEFVGCEITNKAQEICVSKTVTVPAPADAPSAADFVISVGVDADGDGIIDETIGGTPDGCSDGETQFLVPPATDFTLSEDLTVDPRFAPTSMTCSGPGLDAATATAGQLAAGALPVVGVGPDTGRVNCSITNETMRVCVTKEYRPDVKVTPIAMPITLSVDTDGDGIFDQVESQTPDDNPNCNVSIDSAEFYLPPGTDFTLGEDLTADPRFAPTRMTCRLQGFDDVVATDAQLDAVAFSFDVGSNTESVTCRITNETVRVCIRKTGVPRALMVPPAIPIPITMSVDTDGDEIPDTALPSSLPGNSTGCGNNSAEFFVPPGATFTLGEDLSVDPRFAPTSMNCSDAFASAEELAAAAFTLSLDRDGTDLSCVINNESMQICVTKFVSVPTSFGAAPAVPITINLDTDRDGVFETEAASATPGADSCSGDNSAAFFLAPGTDFALGEDLSADPGIGARSMECSGDNFAFEATAAEVAAAFAAFSIPDATTSVFCSITNGTTQICVAKIFVGSTPAVRPAFPITIGIDTNGDGIADSLIANEPPGDNPGCPGFPDTIEAFVAPGADFVLGEDLSVDNRFALRRMECTQAGSTAFEATADQLAAAALPVALDPDRGDVKCEIDNATMQVCVTKTVALPVVVDPPPAAIPITISADLDGDGVREEADSATPGMNPACNPDRDVTVEFFLPPGTDFTLGEDLIDPIVGPTEMSCSNAGAGLDAQATASELDAASFDVDVPSGLTSVRCAITNSAVRVCVTKRVLGPTSLDPAPQPMPITLSIDADGDGVAETEIARATPALHPECNDTLDSVVFSLAPGTDFTLSEDLSGDLRFGPTSMSCFGAGLDAVNATEAQLSEVALPIVIDRSVDNVFCSIDNATVRVEIDKKIIVPNEGAAEVSDFAFDVYIDGTLSASGSDPSAAIGSFVAHVRPGAEVRIVENPLPGYTYASANCTLEGHFDVPRRDEAEQIFTVPQERVLASVKCLFLNDSAAPVPVCVTKNFTGGGGFSLADWSFELFGNSGILLGSVNAGAASDPLCADGGVFVGNAFADGSSHTVNLIAPSDPNLVLDAMGCSLNTATTTQATDAAEPIAMFTPDSTTTSVSCVATSRYVAPTTTTPTTTPTTGPATSGATATPPFGTIAVSSPSTTANATMSGEVIDAESVLALTGAESLPLSVLGVMMAGLGCFALGAVRFGRELRVRPLGEDATL